jgi:hypothetical protein
VDEVERALIALAVESWRFSRAFARLARKLEVADASRYASQFDYFQKAIGENLQAAAMTLVNLEGQEFDPGMAVTAVNLNDFAAADRLLVDQMIEPIVMGREGLLRQGIVMLTKWPQ